MTEHEPVWDDIYWDDDPASCSCGFNGTPEECKIMRDYEEGVEK